MAGGSQPYEGGYGMNPLPMANYVQPPPQSLEDYARQMLARWQAQGLFAHRAGAQPFRQAFIQPGGDPLAYLRAHPGFVSNQAHFIQQLSDRYGINLPSRKVNFGGNPPQGSGGRVNFGGSPPVAKVANPAADSLRQLGNTVNKLIKAHAGTFGYAGAM